MTLSKFLDETIRKSAEKGYHPTTFMTMREKYGDVGSIKRLVESGEKQSGFVRLRQLKLLDYSLETAVLRFPDEPGFTQTTRVYAKARLDGILDK